MNYIFKKEVRTMMKLKEFLKNEFSGWNACY